MGVKTIKAEQLIDSISKHFLEEMEMSWVPLLLFLSLTINNLSEASHSLLTHKLHSAVVVGTVYCDTCFQEFSSKPSHFISGHLFYFNFFFSSS